MANPQSKKLLFLAAGLLVVCSVLFVLVLWQEQQRQFLEVIFFDVGQGDSILIKTPSHHNILIDGGPDSSVLSKLGRNVPFYDHTIDLMILTHGHADHLTGLVEVLKRYDVEHVLYNGVQTTSADFLAWQDLIQDKHISTTIAQAGQSFQFGGTTLEVLYPFDDVSTQTFKDLNNSSVVTRLVYQDTSFLFTGDAPVEVEEELISFYCQDRSWDQSHPEQNDCLLPGDVLKVGHHGSKYSSSADFLRTVNPAYAVIYAGQNNRYGHPHRITLHTLEQLGVTVLRTDEVGDVTLVSDGVRVRKK